MRDWACLKTACPWSPPIILEAGADHRVLAVSAETRNIVNYAVMRTSRGDLIDSSPLRRARLLSGKHDAG